MKEKRILVAVGALALAAIPTAALAAPDIGSLGKSAAQPESVPFATSELRVEINSTDGDAGLQVDLDGEPWSSIQIAAPNGRTILDIRTRAQLGTFGLTELFSESSEPPFEELPLEEFKAIFPEGTYTFSGRTVDGKRLTGAAELSHAFPAGPTVTSPEADATVDPGALVIAWQGADAPGIEIVAYQVIVTGGATDRTLDAEMPATARSFTVPADFVDGGSEYKLEVLAIEASGNQTLTEVPFFTG